VRTPPRVLSFGPRSSARARLERLVTRAPEVVIKISGRIHGRARLKAHIDYISRNGQLDLEDDQGWPLKGSAEQGERVADWAAEAQSDRRRSARSPLGHSLVLSMPGGVDAGRVHDAARAFARDTFGERHEYVFVLHTDSGHPHVHMVVRSHGLKRQRFNPGRGELQAWREAFAERLRERGVEAQATWRFERGVTRRREPLALLKLEARRAAGEAARSWTWEGALHDAALAAFSKDAASRPWEGAILNRQTRVRGDYLSAASQLAASPNVSDQVLGEQLKAFVLEMPAPETRRLALARQLRRLHDDVGKTPSPSLARTPDLAARSHLAMVEAVLTATIVDPAVREQALAAARRRMVYWLERGASFTIARVKPDTREKDRSR
jgi:hypothetical protein